MMTKRIDIETRISGAPNDIQIYHTVIDSDGNEREIGLYSRIMYNLNNLFADM